MRSSPGRVGGHIIQLAELPCKGNVTCIVESRVPKHAYAKLVSLVQHEYILHTGLCELATIAWSVGTHLCDCS